MRKIKQTRHGCHGTKIYKLWADIVKRCESVKSGNYKYYGGRGINVCRTWRESPSEFIKWALENGYEEGLTIDRIDNNGDYNPSNCHFISHKLNCAPGKRRTRKDNKSRITGVYASKSGNYEAYALINGKQKYLGVFKTALEAKNKISEVTSAVCDIESEVKA